MDEWDEFLCRAEITQLEDEEMPSAESEEEEEEVAVETLKSRSTINRDDLGEFGDNAEVLMQMARGESLNTLSSNGVWIKSDVNSTAKSNNSFMGKKRTLKSTGSTLLSVPIANSFQDLTKAITGHPSLSHPLSLLKQQNIYQKKAYEIDSLGLFFYGAPGDVKVEWTGKDDMMKIIEMKKILIDKSIIFNEETCENNNSSISNFDFNFDASINGIQISHENLKLLAGSIPPNGKTGWIIPITIISNAVDLTGKAVYKFDPIGLLFEYCEKSIYKQLGNNLLEPTEHLITENSFKVLVKTYSPPFIISMNFRGECHVDPTAILSNFLFYRQSNYSIEIDFESLKVKSIKSFLPKFDHQNRLFLLLKALKNKLTKLTDGNYFLLHQPNTPFIKILSLETKSEGENEILLQL